MTKTLTSWTYYNFSSKKYNFKRRGFGRMLTNKEESEAWNGYMCRVWWEDYVTKISFQWSLFHHWIMDSKLLLYFISGALMPISIFSLHSFCAHTTYAFSEVISLTWPSFAEVKVDYFKVMNFYFSLGHSSEMDPSLAIQAFVTWKSTYSWWCWNVE